MAVVAFENPMFDDPVNDSSYQSLGTEGLYDEPAFHKSGNVKQNPIYVDSDEFGKSQAKKPYFDVNGSNSKSNYGAYLDTTGGSDAYLEMPMSNPNNYAEPALAVSEYQSQLSATADVDGGYLKMGAKAEEETKIAAPEEKITIPANVYVAPVPVANTYATSTAYADTTPLTPLKEDAYSSAGFGTPTPVPDLVYSNANFSGFGAAVESAYSDVNFAADPSYAESELSEYSPSFGAPENRYLDIEKKE